MARVSGDLKLTYQWTCGSEVTELDARSTPLQQKETVTSAVDTNSGIFVCVQSINMV